MPERRPDGGVRVYDDHRDNLTIDVDNELVRSRAAEMRHEFSESALLWNVFRTLQKIDLRLWLPRFVRHALPDAARAGVLGSGFEGSDLQQAAVAWWRRFDVPESRHAWLRDAAQNGALALEHYPPHSVPEKRSEIERRLAAGAPFEDPVEVPLCIETPRWLVCIDAVYKGNLRKQTAFDARRDAVLRLLDAGSAVAAGASKTLATIVLCTDTRLANADTARLVDRYRGRPERLAEALPHREDGPALEQAAQCLGLLRWRDLGALLIETKAEERLGLFDVAVLDELVKYLARKDVGFNFFRRLK